MKKKKFPKPKKGNCVKCGVEVIADIPFIDGNLVGRKSEDHGCGKQYTHIVLYLDTSDPDLEGLFE